MAKYEIEHSNTDVRKLWTLAHNGVFAHATVKHIFENDVDDKIVFNSKYAYDTWMKFKNTNLALYKN